MLDDDDEDDDDLPSSVCHDRKWEKKGFGLTTTVENIPAFIH